MVKKTTEKVKKVAKKVENNAEKGARRAVLEDLFNDFNKSRTQVYKMSFFRGLFFGFGSVLGGTVVVALAAWILSWLADIPGGFGEFIEYIVRVVESS